MNKTLTINSHRGEYNAFFMDNFSFMDELKERKGAIWVVDRNVFVAHKEIFNGIDDKSLILFDAREEGKNLDAAIKLYKDLISRLCTRKTPFISVGGGVTQDVTGFVASTLYRGLSWTYIPTTLLAQVDSCIGSKTSLNFDSYKNILGTFYPPKEIYISTKFLEALDEEHMFSGMGEVVKLHFIKSKNLKDINDLAEHLAGDGIADFAYESNLIKKGYIEEDEFDSGIRKILNYGHSFGHAFETVSEFTIPHGLAVVTGMIFSNIIALQREVITSELFDISVKRILIPSLHLNILKMKDKYFDAEALWEAMKKDKKSTGGGAAIILPKGDFSLELVQDLSREELSSGLEKLKSIIA